MTAASETRPGARNDLTDVAGLRVGSATFETTGVTAVLFDVLSSCAVDVRGGGPATRETDPLRPENLLGAAHAVVFSGGSVFGLAAADGVTRGLSAAGVGVRLRDSVPPAPIVPAAAIYDLPGWPATWSEPPDYAALGREAFRSAANEPVSLGAVGAGRGARAGARPGGQGCASAQLDHGGAVAALVVANPVGSTRTAADDAYLAYPFEIAGEFGGERPKTGAPPLSTPLGPDTKLAGLAQGPGARENTTLALVATDVALSTAALKRVAIMAHDGFARAVRPAHTPFDGDVVFAVSTAIRAAPPADALALSLAEIGSAAADVVARALTRGVHHARRTEN